ncbi:MAG: DUF5911 domain-containing protein, partial [Thermoplasmata archaeon]|nr:DUF5911 domain-containing protein [Thermoplasmata archaeon]
MVGRGDADLRFTHPSHVGHDRRAAVPGMKEPRRSTLPSPSDLRDYGVIGNLHTAALVSRFGSIDWACLPRFGSPSVFARLLDARRGGFQAIRPVEPSRSEQSYVPSTAILETHFDLTRDRRLVVTDFMPVGSAPGGDGLPIIVRLAEAHGGPVKIRATFAPRFDYGAKAPEWREGLDGWVAESENSRLLYRVPEGVAPVRERIELERTLAPGSVFPCEILAGGRRRIRETPARLLEDTLRFWRGWVHTPSTPLHAISGSHHAWVERSEITLKLLSNADTGTFVAAPTTSLPEWPGGTRNWDYRFVWIRDA